MATFTIDGKEFTLEQIMALRAEADKAAKLVKAAEKAGFIEKAKKAPKEKAEDSPEVTALKDAFRTIVEANVQTIEALFKETVTEDKPLGNIGVNLNLGGKFHVQILNEETRKAKTPSKKDKPGTVTAPAENA